MVFYDINGSLNLSWTIWPSDIQQKRETAKLWTLPSGGPLRENKESEKWDKSETLLNN